MKLPLVAASLWRPLVITDAGERESAERELRERSTRVSTGLAWAAAGSLGCSTCFLGEAVGLAGFVDFWVGARRIGSDLQRVPKIIKGVKSKSIQFRHSY